MAMSFSGLSCRNFSRTSSSGVSSPCSIIRIFASAGICRKLILQPTHPALRAVGPQRRALDDGRGRKGKVRNQHQIPDAPVARSYLRKKKFGVWSPRSARIMASKAPSMIVMKLHLLPLELVLEPAPGTSEIPGLGIVGQAFQNGRRAIGAVKILLAPRFR